MINKNKNIQGFTLILSLVLLIAMSLMGGTLIVLSSSDHRDNNNDDLSQQAFYVAETGLLEAEKYLVNSFLGLPRRAIADGVEAAVTDTSKKGIPPTNTIDVDQSSVCYKSFKNIINLEKVVAHHTGGKFYNIVKPIVDKIYASATDKEEKFKTSEERFLNNYTYEYFMVNVGKAEFQEAGSSVAQGSIDVIKAGTAYRIYACGMMGDVNNPEILIPLESIIVLSH